MLFLIGGCSRQEFTGMFNVNVGQSFNVTNTFLALPQANLSGGKNNIWWRSILAVCKREPKWETKSSLDELHTNVQWQNKQIDDDKMPRICNAYIIKIVIL